MNCHKDNHWAKVCNSNPQGITTTNSRHRNRANPRDHQRRRSASRNCRDGDESVLSDQFESITVGAITPRNPSEDEIFMTIGIDLHKLSNRSALLKAKLDTGAQGNIVPLRLYCRMYPEYLKREAVQQSPTVLTAYGGRKIKQHGKCAITCEFNRRRTEAPPIIGLPTSLELNLFTLKCSLQKNLEEKNHPAHEKNVPIKDKDDLVKQYPGCFDGIRKFQGQYHITGDPSKMPPVARAQRRVPLNPRKDIKHEVDDMSKGIIMKLKEGEPTAWVNSLVYCRKPNAQLRICFDPKDLNKAIHREHHVILTLEEILPKLVGAKFFSIMDANCSYWNVNLDLESSHLTTFNLPFGGYRFLRMPFGIKMSQDVFQAKIDQSFEGCSSTVGSADDIVIYGKSEEARTR